MTLYIDKIIKSCSIKMGKVIYLEKILYKTTQIKSNNRTGDHLE